MKNILIFQTPETLKKSTKWGHHPQESYYTGIIFKPVNICYTFDKKF